MSAGCTASPSGPILCTIVHAHFDTVADVSVLVMLSVAVDKIMSFSSDAPPGPYGGTTGEARASVTSSGPVHSAVIWIT